MKYFRIAACVLMLLLFAGCAGMVRNPQDEVEAAREAKAAQEAVAREMAEIEEAKQEAREKVRSQQETEEDEITGDTSETGTSEGIGVSEETGTGSDVQSKTEKTDDQGTVTGSDDKAQTKDTIVPETKPAATSSLRFRNKKLLDQHYTKHGIEMGFGSAAEYEAAAAAVVSKPGVMHKTEAEDGDDVYYVPASNEFVVVSTDGYIRTYFLPDSGIKYYNKQ